VCHFTIPFVEIKGLSAIFAFWERIMYDSFDSLFSIG
jgi:hypothetical protein